MEKKILDTIDRVVSEGVKVELSDPETRLLALVRGEAPVNASEKLMSKQIQKIKAAGQVVDIPFN